MGVKNVSEEWHKIVCMAQNNHMRVGQFVYSAIHHKLSQTHSFEQLSVYEKDSRVMNELYYSDDAKIVEICRNYCKRFDEYAQGIG